MARTLRTMTYTAKFCSNACTIRLEKTHAHAQATLSIQTHLMSDPKGVTSEETKVIFYFTRDHGHWDVATHKIPAQRIL